MDTELATRLDAIEWVDGAVALVEVDSTNLAAGRRVDDGAGPGLVVTARRQTAGRGRRGRSWDDVAGGNVALSVVVGMPDAATLLPLAAGLALAEVLADHGATTSIKWPNDVRALVEGQPRKCAGILVETRTCPDGGRVAVVGIGVDVDWRHVTRTTDARAWTSVAEALGHPVVVDDLVVDLVAALGRWVQDLDHDAEAVRTAAVAACDTLGRRVRVERERARLVGLATDLDGDGALVLDVDGDEHVVTAGDVVHLRAAD